MFAIFESFWIALLGLLAFFGLDTNFFGVS
jgi:hypothetical protein